MGPSQESFSREKVDKVSGLTTRESVELFQEAHDKAVDEAHSTLQQSLTGVENAGETVKPKLTLDLRKRSLSQIPKEVVAIIGQDVERYEPSVLCRYTFARFQLTLHNRELVFYSGIHAESRLL